MIKKIDIYTDGGSRGNPGPAGIGVYAITDKKQVLFQLSEYIGNTTNNVAEWQGVVKALEYLIANQIQTEQLNFFLDSELVVNQINGKYKIKKPHLQVIAIRVRHLLRILNFVKVYFNHVPREKNKFADSLVNQALDSL